MVAVTDEPTAADLRSRILEMDPDQIVKLVLRVRPAVDPQNTGAQALNKPPSWRDQWLNHIE